MTKQYRQWCFIHLHDLYFLISTPLQPVHKSRSSRRGKEAEPHDCPEALGCSHVSSDASPDALQTTRLTELLSPSGFRPTPPSMPKFRERLLSNSPSPSTAVSSVDQTEAGRRDCMPLKKSNAHMSVQTARAITNAHTSPQKHRRHKARTSEKATTKDQTRSASLRRSSSVDHKSPPRKAQSATHAPMSTRAHREYNKEHRRRRNEAARIIQRAWRRRVYIFLLDRVCVCTRRVGGDWQRSMIS